MWKINVYLLMLNKPRRITIPNSEGISPVIGILLMVSVTVILAVIVAVFVLDLGNGQSAPSTAGVEFSETADGVEVMLVVSGTAEEIEIVSNGNVLATWDGNDVGSRVTVTGVGPTDSLVIRGTNGGSSTVIKSYVVQRPHSPSLTPQLVAGGGGGGGGGGGAVSPCGTAPTGALVVDSASGTDDGASPYQTVSAAVAAASNGDTIWVADGTYTLEVLVGKDLTITTDCAVGVGSGASSQYAFYVAPGADLTVDGFELRDYGTVGGMGWNDSAILLSSSNGASLNARNLQVENSAAAVNIRSSSGLGTILLDNVSAQNTYWGVYAGSSDATELTIRDSEISGAGNNAVVASYLYSGTPLTIEGTTIENSGQDGVYHTSTGNVVSIVDSRLVNNGGDGFYHAIPNLFTLQVDNTVFENNGGSGLTTEYVNADTSYIRNSEFNSQELRLYYVFDSSYNDSTFDAEQNWWGQASGPASGQITTDSGSVDTDPYCTVSDCTTTS